MSEIVVVITGATGPAGGGGGSTALDDLTDVVITAAASGDIIRHNGTNWVDAVGTTHFDAAGSAAAAQAASQPLDTDLTAIAALTSAADKVAYATGAGTWALADLTAAGRAILDDADATAQRATLGLVIGTNVQAQDAELAAIAGLTSAADSAPYFTGSGTAALMTVTTAARTVLDDASVSAMRATLDVPSNAEAILDTLIDAKGDIITATAADTPARLAVGATNGHVLKVASGEATGLQWAGQTETLIIAVGDETTAITTGTAKVTWRMPFAMTVSAVRSSLTTASSSGLPTVDINEGGVSILSTKLTIDANELTSTTAATAAVISDTALADDASMTIDIDTAGTGAAGLKVYLIGTRA